LQSLKKILKDNLSLSSKLTLRELLRKFRAPEALAPADRELLQSARDRNRDLPRVVVFDERVPSPDRDAGSLRMLIILKTLSEWCHVTFLPFSRPLSFDYERALWKEGIETADAVDYRSVLKHPAVKAAIISRASMGSVFVHRLRRDNPNVGIIFDTVDIHFHRLQREYEVSGNTKIGQEAGQYRRLESKLARSSDVVWCASGEDKEVMRREVPEANVEVVPTIHELRDAGPTFSERSDLLFIGNLAHRPNDDAVLFFMREVFPLVRRSLPAIRLDIIGDNPSPAIVAFNSADVRIRGYVPDVESYLRSGRVFVAPLRFGAGIKGKVGEAMAYGIPVVTTSIGAEGFGATHDLDIMLADDPASFAEAIKQLYSDEELWQRLATNSRLLIKRHFTPEVVAETINRSIREVGAQKSGGKPAFPTPS
jgi:glycosyltransferase involved in cell wall biosynthesis